MVERGSVNCLLFASLLTVVFYVLLKTFAVIFMMILFDDHFRRLLHFKWNQVMDNQRARCRCPCSVC